MKINLIIFGQLTDITGTDNLALEDIDNTDQLQETLLEKFPAIINSKYRMAVDKKMISENTTLADNCTVALLPPFSGG